MQVYHKICLVQYSPWNDPQPWNDTDPNWNDPHCFHIDPVNDPQLIIGMEGGILLQN